MRAVTDREKTFFIYLARQSVPDWLGIGRRGADWRSCIAGDSLAAGGAGRYGNIPPRKRK